MIKKSFDVDLASISDRKFLYDFAKKKSFDVKAQGDKSIDVDHI